MLNEDKTKDLKINKKIASFAISFVIAASMAGYALTRKRKWNR